VVAGVPDIDGARLAADAIVDWPKYSARHTIATTGDLSPENSKRFTNASSLARSHMAIARIHQPQIFFQCLRLRRASFLTQA
jgi:hypothetical protein